MDEDYFTIDQASGQLYLAVPTPLDYDVDQTKLMHPKREYTVTVLVTDPFYSPLDVIPGVGKDRGCRNADPRWDHVQRGPIG